MAANAGPQNPENGYGTPMEAAVYGIAYGHGSIPGFDQIKEFAWHSLRCKPGSSPADDGHGWRCNSPQLVMFFVTAYWAPRFQFSV